MGHLGPGGVGIQGNNNTINQINKIDLGSLPEFIKAFSDRENASKELLDEANQKRDEIAATLDITQGAVGGFFETLGVQDVLPERLKAKLIEIASQFEATRQRLAAMDPDDPMTQALAVQAQIELDKGDPDAASALLQRAEEADLAAAAQARAIAQEASTAADARQLKGAKVRESRGDIELGQLRYGEAAEHFGAAASLMPTSSSSDRARLLLRQAETLLRQGTEYGDNAALVRSIALWSALSHQEFPRGQVPLAWANVQMGLGNALRALGERETGTARLEQAVAAYRLVLQEITRERMPQDWAKAQIGLGWALRAFGEHEAGTVRLQEVVTASRDALKEWTRQHMPFEWASMQVVLGCALWTLGQREAGTASLEEAATAFRAALQEWTRGGDPTNWSATRHNLGLVLRTLGQREVGTARLEEAVTVLLDALQETPRERMPALWAYSQHDLADALAALAKRQTNAALMKEALTCMRGAVEVYQQGEESFWLPVAQSRVKEMEAELVGLQR
jgi:tetratricopeptide (TPR) repeat protein